MNLLIIVMIATGVAGGLAGYFISLDRGTDKQEPSDDSTSNIVAPWFKYVFLGVIAAFIVPLFLSLAQSNLVTELLKNGTVTSDIFVFAGFCLVAAISSRAFIQSISDRVLREARSEAREARKTAEAAREQAEQAIDSITEPEPDEEPATAQAAAAAAGGAPAVAVGDRGKAILHGLRDRGYTLRSTGGLAKDTGLQKEEVIDELDRLTSDGLVRMASIEKKGKTRIRWMITLAGRDNIS